MFLIFHTFLNSILPISFSLRCCDFTPSCHFSTEVLPLLAVETAGLMPHIPALPWEFTFVGEKCLIN